MAGRPMLQLIAVIVGAYVVFMGGLHVFQRNMMYFPSTAEPHPARSGVPEMTPVDYTTADGLTLTSWYREAGQGKPTIVYFHGNAGHMGYRGFKVRPYLDDGLGVLLAAYRGFGGNPGRPSEQGLYADGRAALAYLAGRGVPSGRVVLYGESLGTGVAVHLAHEAATAGGGPVGAVVLEAPYDSMGAVAAHHYPYVPARTLIKDRYDSAAKIGTVAAPVLILHGERDRTIPIKFGRRLFDAAQEPKESWWHPRAGHEDLYDYGADEAVIDFLGRRVGP